MYKVAGCYYNGYQRATVASCSHRCTATRPYLREPLCGCAASCSRVSMTNHLRLRGGEGDERLLRSSPYVCHDNSRLISNTFLTEFEFSGLLQIQGCQSVCTVNSVKPLKIQWFWRLQAGQSGITREEIPAATDQKAGGSNPSRRAKKTRNLTVSGLFVCISCCFLPLLFSDPNADPNGSG